MSVAPKVLLVVGSLDPSARDGLAQAGFRVEETSEEAALAQATTLAPDLVLLEREDALPLVSALAGSLAFGVPIVVREGWPLATSLPLRTGVVAGLPIDAGLGARLSARESARDAEAAFPVAVDTIELLLGLLAQPGRSGVLSLRGESAGAVHVALSEARTLTQRIAELVLRLRPLAGRAKTITATLHETPPQQLTTIEAADAGRGGSVEGVVVGVVQSNAARGQKLAEAIVAAGGIAAHAAPAAIAGLRRIAPDVLVLDGASSDGWQDALAVVRTDPLLASASIVLSADQLWRTPVPDVALLASKIAALRAPDARIEAALQPGAALRIEGLGPVRLLRAALRSKKRLQLVGPSAAIEVDDGLVAGPELASWLAADAGRIEVRLGTASGGVPLEDALASAEVPLRARRAADAPAMPVVGLMAKLDAVQASLRSAKGPGPIEGRLLEELRQRTKPGAARTAPLSATATVRAAVPVRSATPATPPAPMAMPARAMPTPPAAPARAMPPTAPIARATPATPPTRLPPLGAIAPRITTVEAKPVQVVTSAPVVVADATIPGMAAPEPRPERPTPAAPLDALPLDAPPVRRPLRKQTLVGIPAPELPESGDTSIDISAPPDDEPHTPVGIARPASIESSTAVDVETLEDLSAATLPPPAPLDEEIELPAPPIAPPVPSRSIVIDPDMGAREPVTADVALPEVVEASDPAVPAAPVGLPTLRPPLAPTERLPAIPEEPAPRAPFPWAVVAVTTIAVLAVGGGAAFYLYRRSREPTVTSLAPVTVPPAVPTVPAVPDAVPPTPVAPVIADPAAVVLDAGTPAVPDAGTAPDAGTDGVLEATDAGLPTVVEAPPTPSADGPLEGTDEGFDLSALGIAPEPPPSSRRVMLRRIRDLLASASRHRSQDRLEAAQADYGTVLALDAANPRATAGMSIVAEAAGDHTRALVFAQRLVRLRSYPTNWVFLGDAWLAAGDASAARRCYERALELDPRHREARQHLAELE